jgi:G8 domain/Right handed beta helix region
MKHLSTKNLSSTNRFGFATAFLCIGLSACGGGGGDSTGAAPAAGGPLSFGGSAATGAAIPNAAVDVKCLGGATASSTTSNLGSYRLTLPQAARLPCIVRVAASGGALHAAVDETYVSGEVNITPLTELTLARSGGRAASNLFAALGATAPSGLSAASLSAAHGEVVNTFRPLVNFSNVRSFAQDALVPAVAGVRSGNTLDQQIDQLNAALAARSSSYTLVGITLLSAANGTAAATQLWGTPGTGPVGNPGPTPTGVLAVSTSSIAFGAQVNNSASNARSVTLTNTGSTSLTLASIGLTGSDASSFVRSTSNCTNGMIMAVNDTCTYSVVFQPIALGDKAASVSISHNAGGSNSPMLVSLSGTSQNVPATVTQQLVADATNVSATAKSVVQNFVASTYDAFISLVTGLGSRDAAPAASLASAPTSYASTSNQKNWSDAATWGGTLPTAGSAVVIPAGTTIVLNTSTPSLGAITINGTLQFARQDVALTASNITVASTGALLIGTYAIPFTNKATITLTGARPAFPTNPTATNRNIDNTRGITVNGGKLEMYGASPSPVWTQINDHAAAGATSLTLKQAVNWAAGSKIIVGPTDYYGVNPTETLTLASTASGSSLSTTAALSKFRWGKLQYMTDNGLSLTPGTYTPPVTPAPTQLDQRAAVGNLSRNIVIQGANDSDWTTKGFGAHVMIMDLASKVFVDGVEFNRVGQAGAMGRYPFHWHMLSYRSSDGAFLGDATGHEIRNSTISESAQRCIVVHGTNGVRVANNICHDIKGHAFFLEDAVERRNVFEGNLALKMRRPANADLILQHEGEPFLGGPSGFWITNPNNTFRNNVAGDAAGNGYWNSFPISGVGLSRKAVNPDLAGTQWATLQMNPLNMPHGTAVFDNNVAYSTAQPGVNTNIMLSGGGPVGDDLGNTGPDQWKPTFDGRPYDINGVKPGGATGSATSRATFSRMTIYKTISGYTNRVVAPDYPEWVMSDIAGTYASGAGSDGAFFRGLFIGKSLNDKVGGVDTYPAGQDKQNFFATYHSTFQMRDNTFAHIGYEEKPGDIERTESGVFKSDDYYTEQMERGTILNSNNKFVQAFAGARSMPANLLTINRSSVDRPDLTVNYTLAGAIWDPHGYWGNKGFYWTYNTPFYVSGGGCEPSLFPTANGKNSAGKYNGQSCSGQFYGMRYSDNTDFMVGNNNVSNWPMDVERVDCNPALYNGASWGTAARACRQVIGSGWESWKLGNMRGASLRQGGKFILRFPNPADVNNANSGGRPVFSPGITQGTMVNAEGQTVATTIPKVVDVIFTNLTRETDSIVFAVSFDGTKTPVGVYGLPGSGKRHQWRLPPNPDPGNVLNLDQSRVLVMANSLAEVEADTTGTKMWQDRPNNLVYVKLMGGLRLNPWYRIVNQTAPFGQDLYNEMGLYIKDSAIPNQ